jgi:hypothetical protein
MAARRPWHRPAASPVRSRALPYSSPTPGAGEATCITRAACREGRLRRPSPRGGRRRLIAARAAPPPARAGGANAPLVCIATSYGGPRMYGARRHLANLACPLNPGCSPGLFAAITRAHGRRQGRQAWQKNSCRAQRSEARSGAAGLAERGARGCGRRGCCHPTVGPSAHSPARGGLAPTAPLDGCATSPNQIASGMAGRMKGRGRPQHMASRSIALLSALAGALLPPARTAREGRKRDRTGIAPAAHRPASRSDCAVQHRVAADPLDTGACGRP